jgi:hypothetical protein
MGRASAGGQKTPENRFDSAAQERKQRILSQLAAPVMRKTLPLDLGTSNDAGDKQANMLPEHVIYTGESSGSQHHVHVPPDGAEEQEEYNWYVSAFSPSLGCTCQVLMQSLLHQSDLSRSHPSGADGTPNAKLHAHVPPAMLRRLDLDDSETSGLLSR